MANELIPSNSPYTLTKTGFEIQRTTSREEWEAAGEGLRLLDEAKQWAIGDWLVDGKSHYGDKLYERASDLLGLDERTLRQYKHLSERFDLLCRHNNLSFEHHRQVAPIKKTEVVDGELQLSDEYDTDKQQELLSDADSQGLTVRDLRQVVSSYKQRQEQEIALYNEPEKYSIILADPAWEYDFSRSDSRQIENQYQPSSIEEMGRLRVPAAENAVLFMWATSPKLREALRLLDKWDFEYKTCMVWVKDKIGMGYYARQKHEMLLIATRGDGLELPDPSNRPESVFEAPRQGHSEKPNAVYEIIERMYPEYNKLEMFARQEREGWATWGDES